MPVQVRLPAPFQSNVLTFLQPRRSGALVSIAAPNIDWIPMSNALTVPASLEEILQRFDVRAACLWASEAAAPIRRKQAKKYRDIS